MDLVEEPGPRIEKKNVLKHIWFSPAATFRFLAKEKSGKYVNTLFALGAVSGTLKRSAGWNIFNPSQEWYLLLLITAASIVIAWIIYHIYAFLIQLIAKAMGGNGHLLSVKVVLAWSLIPYICSTLLILPKFAYFGMSIFSDQKVLAVEKASTLLNVISGLELLFWLWTAIILVVGVKTVHNINFFKAIVSVVVSPLVLTIFSGALAFLILDLL